MHLWKKENRAKDLDDFAHKLRQEHYETIDDSVEASKEFAEDENRQHYIEKHFRPGGFQLYNAFKSSLESKFGTDLETNIFGEENEKKVKEAIVDALIEYFKLTKPELVDAVANSELTLDDKFEKLTATYDDMHGVDPRNQDPRRPISIRYVLGHTKDKDGNLGDLLESMGSRTNDMYHQNAFGKLAQKYNTAHFTKFDRDHLWKHTKEKIKESRYELDDEGKLAKADEGDYIKILQAIKYDEWEDIKLETYGLKKKEEKK
jgi:hypothetical protein